MNSIKAASRIQSVSHQFTASSSRHFSSSSPVMSRLDMNSKVKLASGYEIPRLGYGVYQTPENVAEEVTNHAIKCGYRHVDSATVYRNEGPSAAGMLKSKVPREQLFFTSKVPSGSINYEGAKNAIDLSLQKTGLGYFDLYLLHAPFGGKEGRLGAWRALVEAAEAGKVRSIGVSNYGVHHLNELEEWQKQQPSKEKAGILSVNQIELHPWLARQDIVSWCEQRDVVLEAYSPLVRSTRMDDPMLQPLAKKHGKTPAQILLRWGLQKGFVILPKSETKSRIEENTKLYDFELDAEDMKSLHTTKYEPCTWDPTISPLEK